MFKQFLKEVLFSAWLSIISFFFVPFTVVFSFYYFFPEPSEKIRIVFMGCLMVLCLGLRWCLERKYEEGDKYK